MFLFVACSEGDYIKKDLIGEWELLSIYFVDIDNDLLKNDSSNFAIITDNIVIDKYGNFIMVLLSNGKKIKGKFIYDSKRPEYLAIETASDERFKGIYKFNLKNNNGNISLVLESDIAIINARRNPSNINL